MEYKLYSYTQISSYESAVHTEAARIMLKKLSARKPEITASVFKSFRFNYLTNAAFPWFYVLFS